MLGNHYINQLGGKDTVLAMNVTQLNLLPALKILPKFYQEVISYVNKTKANSREEMLMQPLWGNTNITYFNKSAKEHVIFKCLFKAWIDSDTCTCITHVADIETIKTGQILQDFLYEKISNHIKIYAEIVKIRKALKWISSLLQSNIPKDSHNFDRG